MISPTDPPPETTPAGHDPEPLSPPALVIAGGVLSLVVSGVGVMLVFALVLALGWAVSRVTSLTVFQGALLATGLVISSRLGRGLTHVQDELKTLILEMHQIHHTLEDLSPWGLADDEDEPDEEDDDDEEPAPDVQIVVPPRSGNERCPCGSGRKYKNCHGAKHH